ncbi:MAG: trypsin-like serine protease [Frankiaceae bacterium]
MGKRLRAAIATAAAALGILTGTTGQASAITFGTDDGNLHPEVGAMIVQYPDGTYDLWCSGTLISTTVFLTAAHCGYDLADYGIGTHDVYVTLDPTWQAGRSKLLRGTYHYDPQYGGAQSDPHDIAVIVLDRAVTGVTPATLPRAHELDALAASHQLGSQDFTAVGYGTYRDDKTGGPHALGDYGTRKYATQYFNSLENAWLRLSENISTGSGGTCYGDSGGPHFLGGTSSNHIVATTITGDSQCRSTDVDYRLDTDSARAFLGQFVALP